MNPVTDSMSDCSVTCAGLMTLAAPAALARPTPPRDPALPPRWTPDTGEGGPSEADIMVSQRGL